MRRIFSILFVLFFGLGPLAAIVGTGGDATIPACCRRLGAHHCAMSSETDSPSPRGNAHSLQFRAPSRCPLFALRGNASPSPLALIEPPPVAHRSGGTTVAICLGNFSFDRIDLRTPTLRGPPSSPRA